MPIQLLAMQITWMSEFPLQLVQFTQQVIWSKKSGCVKLPEHRCAVWEYTVLDSSCDSWKCHRFYLYHLHRHSNCHVCADKL